MKNAIIRTKDEKLPIRYLETRNLIPEELARRKNAQFVTEAIISQVSREDCLKWSKSAPGRLVPDTTGHVPFRLGESLWSLILTLLSV